MQNLTLNSIHKEIWNLLKNGINEISSTFHFPNLSTISLDGNQTSRTVVLKSINYKIKLFLLTQILDQINGLISYIYCIPGIEKLNLVMRAK